MLQFWFNDFSILLQSAICFLLQSVLIPTEHFLFRLNRLTVDTLLSYPLLPIPAATCQSEERKVVLQSKLIFCEDMLCPLRRQTPSPCAWFPNRQLPIYIANRQTEMGGGRLEGMIRLPLKQNPNHRARSPARLTVEQTDVVWLIRALILLNYSNTLGGSKRFIKINLRTNVNEFAEPRPRPLFPSFSLPNNEVFLLQCSS